MTSTPVIFSYGMGADSTAILLRWLEDPSTRDFDLADLVVLTSMTGDEFSDTGRLVEAHILPRLREAGVRFVQVARKGPKVEDGIAVLDDSTAPTTVYLAGAYRLSDELKTAGTVPQVASGKRTCSQKFKGWVLDRWIEAELQGASFRHVLGFNAEETKRAVRDDSYSTEVRSSEYPLIEWGWTRADLEAYILSVAGVAWPKSCCTFCPFATDRHQDRYLGDPEAAVDAMMIELSSLALNPRSTLFARHSVIEVTTENNPEAAEAFYRRLQEADWAIYEVRRIMFAKGVAWRSVKVLDTGSHVRLHRVLREMAEAQGAALETARGDLVRLTDFEREEGVYPSRERFLVIAPEGVEAKTGRASFETKWAEVA